MHNTIIPLLIIVGYVFLLKLTRINSYNAKQLEPNHECWVKCTDCGTEYDLRTQDFCPECLSKNYIL